MNLNLTAINLDNNINKNPISRTNNYPREMDSDWGQLEIISEPVPNQNNNDDYSYSPKIAVEDNKIYVVWEDLTNYNNVGNDRDIFYRYFNGIKWSDIQVISEPIDGQNYNTGDSLEPDIAVYNSKIYVVWHDNNNTNGANSDMDIFYRCNLSGKSWEPIQVISEPIYGQNSNTYES
ncbi:unnamed protein product, partial [marine sediment metagenome]